MRKGKGYTSRHIYNPAGGFWLDTSKCTKVALRMRFMLVLGEIT